MARDPLRILLVLRQRSVEQARQDLGTCLAAEAGIAERIKALDETTRRDRAVDSSAEDLLAFGDMFARRRGSAQAGRQEAMADLAAAEARSAEARAVVTEARTAAESVNQLICEREALRDAETSRKEQHILDDIARPRAGGNVTEPLVGPSP